MTQLSERDAGGEDAGRDGGPKLATDRLADSTASRVLVVEDFSDLRDLLVRALKGAGIQADGAGSRAQAMDADPEGYQALVIDLRLGSDLGTDLLQEICARDPTAISRCVMMTGGGFSDDLPPGIPVLEKPFRMTALVDAVRELLPSGGRPDS